MSSYTGPTLPEVSRHAIWHHAAGLVVSLTSRELPDDIAERAKVLTSRDYHLPRLIQDTDIYLAFYPKKLPHSALFAPLALTVHELDALIIPAQHGIGFVLSQKTMDAWIYIEDVLISIIRTLMNAHREKAQFPNIVWPRWPVHTGYRARHDTQAEASQCARNAKRAFIALSACTTFAISLWLEGAEETCFARAWEVLRCRQKDPIPPPYLDSLQESVVCTLDPGFRAGTFLSPYTTKWGPWLRLFVRAGVQIWLVWGFDSKYDRTLCVDGKVRTNLLPPDHIITDAQQRRAAFTSTVVPRSETETETRSDTAPLRSDTAHTHSWSTKPIPIPHNYNPPTEAGSGQLSRESWEAFFARMTKARADAILKETPVKKEARLSREADAARHRVGRKSTMYTWEQDTTDPTFYRRSLVYKSQMITEFTAVYAYQRFYWGHNNQWDIVGHLDPPLGTELEPLENDEDYDDVDYNNAPHVGHGLNVAEPLDLTEKIESSMAAAVAEEEEEMGADDEADYERQTFPLPPTPGLGEYLSGRHGFACHHNCWDPPLHAEKALKRSDTRKALGALLFSQTNSAPESIVNCINVVRNTQLGYDELSADWDLKQDLVLNLRLVHLDFARLPNGKWIFILSPGPDSNDDSPWCVALNSPTAALMVYRRNWFTMVEIAQGLLRFHIPFRTVIRSSERPPKYNWTQKSRGLGLRPINYRLTKWDYDMYLKSRNAILTSAAGRAVRLRGGLVGRIAAEVVPDSQVLDGPLIGDEIVAEMPGTYFLDDGVTEETLDRVCGVYHIMTANNYDTAHTSWWPKHDVFLSCGRFSDQWTPDSEAFYLTQREKFEDGSYSSRNSTKWRTDLKMMKVLKDEFIDGSEGLALDFIRRSSRAR